MFTEQIVISNKNPIPNNHEVYGEKLLPGLAYIDIIYQIFKKHDYLFKEFELRNLSIYHPLKVGQYDSVMLTVSCSEAKKDQWMIQIEGQNQRDGILEDEKKLYVSAEMHKTKPVVFNETLDLNSIVRSENEGSDIEKIYEQYQKQGLIHSGFMKAEGKVYSEEAATYLLLSLGKIASSYMEEFLFNPVLIDGSGIGAGILLSEIQEGDERLFLPIFYESFKASSLLQKQCITRIKKSSLQRKGELLFLSMEFFNESGEKIAELRNCASKLVRTIDLIHSDQSRSVKNETQLEMASTIETDTEIQKVPHNMTHRSIVEFLHEILAEKLNKPKEQIEDDIGYYEMGLNSPDLLDLVYKIEKKLNTSFSPTLFFEYTNVAALASYIEKSIASVSPNFKKMDDEMENNSGKYEDTRTNVQDDYGNAIAIIGMAGRYPKANNIREFWDNLKKGEDCISEIPKTRWDWSKYKNVKSSTGREVSKWGGFIENPECFDSRFFRISPQEAEVMDPQERLFLETCWETIEDAGYTPKTLVKPRGSSERNYVGVFVGAMHKDYTMVGADAISKGEIYPISLSSAPIANRISYTFDFHGPSMSIDTLCASSLTAVHLAIESIRRAECDVAIAGGVNLLLHPNKYLIYGIRDMHASDGYCHTFGNGGNGYVSAEGIGAVLLKPLQKAIEDKDNIYAVIKGNFVNHGGNGSGMTVPNQVAITEVVDMCMNKTGIDPRTISYVEAHGTGTLLGDPIEIQGLDKAFKKYTNDNKFCAIGSVKSNIGHTESAAGIMGLHKVALQLYHRELVPSLHSENPNPHINFEQTPFYVQTEYEEWKEPFIMKNGEKVEFPRRAGITCIGASGSNAHIILEEYNQQPIPDRKYVPSNKDDKSFIIPISAKSKKSLDGYAIELYNFLVENLAKDVITDCKQRTNSFSTEVNLNNLSYTLQVGRESMKVRVAFVVKDTSELINNLKLFIEKSNNINNFYAGVVQQVTYDSESNEEEVSKEFIGKLMKEFRALEIAQLWVKGYDINWEDFYIEEKPSRIHLPTYSFEKEHFWIGEKNDSLDKENVNTNHLHFDKEAIKSYSDLEEKIKKVWEKELELQEIDVNDDFMEIGGNSMIAIKIEVELGKIGIYVDHSDINTNPSVAKLASFIDRQGKVDQHTKIMLGNMEPFNHLYYRHCFYNALFPALKYYKKDIIPILINDIPVFEASDYENYRLLDIRYLSKESIEKLMNKQGIIAATKTANDNIADNIISSITNNHPVIIAIDCFYVPIRKDLYQKIHWIHYWLVYGFDTEKKEFHIIEHRHRGSLTYKPYVVNFQNLIDAYSGCLNALNNNEMTQYFITEYWENNEIPTYFEVICDTKNDIVEANLDTYRKVFAENMRNNKSSIISGLKEIKDFEQTYKEIMSNEEVLKKNVDILIDRINSIMNAHKAEVYKLNSLFDNAEDVILLLNKVVDAWEFIRVKISRYAYTFAYNSKSLNSTVDKFMHVYDYEMEFYETYFSFLDKYKE